MSANPFRHQTPRRAAPSPRTPHPSWHQALLGDGPAAPRKPNAGEFWARLWPQES